MQALSHAKLWIKLTFVSAIIVSQCWSIVQAAPAVITQGVRTVSQSEICSGAPVTVTIALRGEAPEIPGGKDVILVIDRSTSMTGENPLRELRLPLAKEASKQFIDQLNAAQDRLGLVAFSGSAVQFSGLTADFNAVKNAIDGIQSVAGGTNINDGLEQAFQLLSGISGGTIIILSDGDYNAGGNPIPTAHTIKASGTTIFSIGLGSEVLATNSPGRTTLINIAGTAQTDQNSSGADYYFGQAQLATQLQDIYSRIAGAIKFAPAATNVTITDNLSPNVQLVPGSFSGFGTLSSSGSTVTIQVSQLAAATNRFSYQVRPTELGTYLAVNNRDVVYTDPVDGLQKNLMIENQSELTVLDCSGRGASPVQVPEPITIILFGTGIAGLAGYARRRNR